MLRLHFLVIMDGLSWLNSFSLQNRELSLPSSTYTKAYLESFCNGEFHTKCCSKLGIYNLAGKIS